MILSGDPAVHLRSARTGFWRGCESYLELAAALRERVPEIDYVDLRFDERIYVRPAGSDGAGRDASRQTSAVARAGRRRRR